MTNDELKKLGEASEKCKKLNDLHAQKMKLTTKKQNEEKELTKYSGRALNEDIEKYVDKHNVGLKKVFISALYAAIPYVFLGIFSLIFGEGHTFVTFVCLGAMAGIFLYKYNQLDKIDKAAIRAEYSEKRRAEFENEKSLIKEAIAKIDEEIASIAESIPKLEAELTLPGACPVGRESWYAVPSLYSILESGQASDLEGAIALFNRQMEEIKRIQRQKAEEDERRWAAVVGLMNESAEKEKNYKELEKARFDQMCDTALLLYLLDDDKD